VPVLVLYDIPEVNRVTNPPGGAPSAADYESWAAAFASGPGGHTVIVIVIVEPDGLSDRTCPSTQIATLPEIPSHFSARGPRCPLSDIGARSAWPAQFISSRGPVSELSRRRS
jgi:endoglucanase